MVGTGLLYYSGKPNYLEDDPTSFVSLRFHSFFDIKHCYPLKSYKRSISTLIIYLCTEEKHFKFKVSDRSLREVTDPGRTGDRRFTVTVISTVDVLLP